MLPQGSAFNHHLPPYWTQPMAFGRYYPPSAPHPCTHQVSRNSHLRAQCFMAKRSFFGRIRKPYKCCGQSWCRSWIALTTVKISLKLSLTLYLRAAQKCDALALARIADVAFTRPGSYVANVACPVSVATPFITIACAIACRVLQGSLRLRM